jgi:hypothetical protein
MTTNDDLSRLRDTNGVLFAQYNEALRREDAQRMRAETAEDRIAEIDRLTAHVEMERAHRRGQANPAASTSARVTAQEQTAAPCATGAAVQSRTRR